MLNTAGSVRWPLESQNEDVGFFHLAFNTNSPKGNIFATFPMHGEDMCVSNCPFLNNSHIFVNLTPDLGLTTAKKGILKQIFKS